MKQHAVFHRLDREAPLDVFLCEADDAQGAVDQFNASHPDREDFHELVMAEV